mgnify:CR=1 FL=1
MKDTEYYTELTDNMIETQCMLDLCNGEITIKDVPFEFRNLTRIHQHINLREELLMKRTILSALEAYGMLRIWHI